MPTLKEDPVTKFLARFGLRDLGHFIVGYVSLLLPTINLSSIHVTKAAVLALIPGAAAVAFRQLFPHVAVSATELGTAVGDAERALAKVTAIAPTTTSWITKVEGVAKSALPVADAAVADLTPAVPVAVAVPEGASVSSTSAVVPPVTIPVA